MRRFLLIPLLLLCLDAFCQEVSIYGANILETRESFDMKSISSGTYTVYKKVLVLKQSASSQSNIAIFTDNDRSLVSFSATISSSGGKVIRKVKKQDLESRALAENLADDSYLYYFQAVAPFPFILEYEYTINYKRGITTFPSFVPVTDEDVVLTRGEYSISVPSGTGIQYSSNLEVNIDKQGTRDVYTWKCYDYKGFTSEKMMPRLISIVPNVYAAPVDFMYSKVEGQQGSWKEIGSWLYDLQADTWDLSSQDREKVLSMTSSCKNSFEKVKVLYDYLRNTTRYVSIQLGIGGYKPFPVSTVVRTGFGDCKALSNYLKALLKVCGVESDYYIVNTYSADLIEGFSSVGQMNHAMLAVPMTDEGPFKGDTLWVECTNPILPLGYRHEDIAGHQVVLVKKDGGEVVRCSSYPDSLSRKENNVKILLSSTGDADISVVQNRYLDYVEPMLSFASKSPKEQSDRLSSDIIVAANSFKVDGITNNFGDYPLFGKSYVPKISISYSFSCKDYAESSSDRLFVPLTPLRRGFDWQRGERKNDIWIRSGYTYLDTITLVIPSTFELEGLPKSVNIECAFARLSSSFAEKNGIVTVVVRADFKAGLYPKETYAEYKTAARKFNSMCDAKMVFRRKK